MLFEWEELLEDDVLLYIVRYIVGRTNPQETKLSCKFNSKTAPVLSSHDPFIMFPFHLLPFPVYPTEFSSTSSQVSMSFISSCHRTTTFPLILPLNSEQVRIWMLPYLTWWLGYARSSVFSEYIEVHMHIFENMLRCRCIYLRIYWGADAYIWECVQVQMYIYDNHNAVEILWWVRRFAVVPSGHGADTHNYHSAMGKFAIALW